MILEVGEKVHIIERRYFAEDLRRHLVGEIVKVTDNAIRVKGYIWVYDTMKGFVRKPEVRERVLYPGDRATINVLPRYVNIDELKYVRDSKSLILTDGKEYSLDLNEFGVSR